VIAILGAGKMGEALISGLLRAGRSPAGVLAVVRRPDRAAALRESYGIGVVSAAEAAKTADTLVITVKPQDMTGLLTEIAPHVPADRLIISVAAGITTARIEDQLGAPLPVVRVMSNTPVLVDEAMSAVSPGTHATERHMALVTELLSRVGKVVRVPESQQDAVTALSGSGPAYFALLAEAMIEAGILLGVSREVSTTLVVQTMLGTAKQLRDLGMHPVELRESVTSPGGTTIAAIRELEQAGVRAALLNAVQAAMTRARELASAHE